MVFDVVARIKELAEAGMLVIDPDRERYPHLFKSHRFTDEEIAEHQANYKPKPTYEYGTRGNLHADDDALYGFDNSAPPRYVPIEGEYKVKPRSALEAAGWKVRRSNNPVLQVHADRWIDRETGEIVDKQSVRATGGYIHVAESISDRSLRTHALIASCAPTERDFIRYVLKMRSGRGGFLEPLSEMLDRWIMYAHPGIDSSNRARKRKALRATLYKRAILHDDQTLARGFQILRRNTKRDNLGEGSRAALVLPVKAK